MEGGQKKMERQDLNPELSNARILLLSTMLHDTTRASAIAAAMEHVSPAICLPVFQTQVPFSCQLRLPSAISPDPSLGTWLS